MPEYVNEMRARRMSDGSNSKSEKSVAGPTAHSEVHVGNMGEKGAMADFGEAASFMKAPSIDGELAPITAPLGSVQKGSDSPGGVSLDKGSPAP